MSLPNRVPPRFEEGEKAILGGLLLDSDVIDKVITMLAPEDFAIESHRVIYKAIKYLADNNQPVDWVSLTEVLQKYGRLEAAGGTSALTDLVDAVPSAANVTHYCNVVKEKAQLRRLMSTSAEIYNKCFDAHDDVCRFIDEAEQLVFRVSEGTKPAGFRSMNELTKSAMLTVKSLYDHKSNVTGIPSGFIDLDNYTAGFQNSDLVIVAGRPSMGKTAFALTCAINAAVKHEIPVGLFSLEMSAEQLVLRAFCQTARVDLKRLRTGYLSTGDWGKLVTAAGTISEAGIHIDDSPALSPLEIRARARRLKKEANIGMIMIDYLQLMQLAKSESRQQEISEISRSLKALAKELNIPVIALSQLNRQVEQRQDKRPVLSDLRESGAIEQDADVILFVYRDEVYNKNIAGPEAGIAEIIIGKQRNGPTGTVKLQFHKETSSFRPLSSREEESGMEAL